jgi:hypothetical protein
MASPPRSPSQSPSRPAPRGGAFRGFLHGTGNLLSLLLSPAWVQTFVMTFLGEWGDRSQIATIAMAAGQDYWWVTLGAVCGHAVCTGAAVIGGRAIAGRVSLKVGTYNASIAGGFNQKLLTLFTQSPLVEPSHSLSSVSSILSSPSTHREAVFSHQQNQFRCCARWFELHC